jgi:broad specificity phosphatase PhoE
MIHARRIFLPCFSALLLSQLWACAPTGSRPGEEETVIFLVRHAERADDAGADPGMVMDPQMRGDPPLSAAGAARAALLAETLKDAGLTGGYSTNYRRTLETAAPTAQRTGLEVATYDPDQIASFAESLITRPGRHLVVGHSNTTWDLVKALGGDPGLPIEALEYDRLYVVVMEGNQARTMLLRFGEPFGGSATGGGEATPH